LNDIQALAVTEAHALMALENADVEFLQGSFGAGTGMTCFGFKGGIGSASRRIKLDDKYYHLGILALTNFGRSGDLILPDGPFPSPHSKHEAEHGSVLIERATDSPTELRWQKLDMLMAGAGLIRLGAVCGHGSRDIAIGF